MRALSCVRRGRSAALAPVAVLLCLAPLRRDLSAQGLQSGDLARFRSVGQLDVSPDGRKVAYSVTMRDGPGRPYTQLWILDVATQQSVHVGGTDASGGNPLWSPDGKTLAYSGGQGDQAGLWVAHPDGSGATFVAPVTGSNSPILETGASVTWSPDSRQIAFVSATPGPETEAATGDPRVIRRYLYKPTYTEGNTEFNDNRRLHIFVVDVASHQVKQLTNGSRDEHSIDWSPDGSEILFASDYEPNPDEFFHYDLFTVKVGDGHIRRLTATEGSVFAPRWSPDGKWIAYSGTVRGLTDRESAMEDPHVWLIDANGAHRHQIGGTTDGREGLPVWSPEGTEVWFTVQGRGSVHLARIPVAAGGVGGSPQTAVNDVGILGAFAVGKRGMIAYALATPRDMAELYVKTGVAAPRQLTNLNTEVLGGKQIAKVDSLTFISNDGKFTEEAFLTEPLGMAAPVAGDTFPAKKYPLILNIHGGPHGQNGPAFNFENQVYAAHGFATGETSLRQLFGKRL